MQQQLQDAARRAYTAPSAGSLGGGVAPGSQQGQMLLGQLSGDPEFDAAMLQSTNSALNSVGPQQGISAPTAGGFDQRRFMAEIAQVAPLEAMKLMNDQKAENPFAKVDPKDFTQQSVQRFVQSGGRDYSLLVPVSGAKPTVVPRGSVMIGPDGKPIFTNEAPPEQTAMERSLVAAGIDPKSPQGINLLRAYAQKTATHAPAANQTVYTGSMVQAEGPDGKPVFVMPSKDGTATVVPGLTPPGAKKESDAAANRVKAETDRAKLMIATVDDALKNVGFFTTGATGAVLGKIPGTSSYDLRATVETLKANLGFQQLAEMRAASPTGGALGAIAVQELMALQSTLASVDANQSQEQLAAKLNQIRGHYNKWLNTLQFGGGGTPQNASGGGAAPSGWSVKKVP
jgi:hypothetical protein